jgi:hypothetical protein
MFVQQRQVGVSGSCAGGSACTCSACSEFVVTLLDNGMFRVAVFDEIIGDNAPTVLAGALLYMAMTKAIPRHGGKSHVVQNKNILLRIGETHHRP